MWISYTSAVFLQAVLITKYLFAVPGGLRFDNSIQTSLVQAGEFENLKLESLTKQLYVSAGESINLKSHGNDIKFSSLKDTTLESTSGQVSR